jgi:uncharacterized protein (DUF433 family)
MLVGSEEVVVVSRQAASQTASAEEYSLLEPHPDNWRKQLWLKDRHMTVGQLVYSMRASDMLEDPEAAARNFALPVEQIRQALVYYRRHRQLIEAEADQEKQWLVERGLILEPGK